MTALPSPYDSLRGPIVDARGVPTRQFLDLLYAYWLRTGAAAGSVFFDLLSGAVYTTFFEDQQGNTYLVNNARYNKDGNYWERIDEARTSWMFVQLGVSEPLEEALGLPAQSTGWWLAQPSKVGGVNNPNFTPETPTRKIKTGFTGAAGGWERAMSATQFGDGVLKGYGFEYDGNGNVPFGRSLAGYASTIVATDYRITGLKYNAYLDDSGTDRAVKSSGVIGIFANDSDQQVYGAGVVFAPEEDSGAGANDVGTSGPTWSEVGFFALRVAASVNYPTLSPGVTGDPVTLAAAGSDSDVSVKLAPKGAGNVLAKGGGTGLTVQIEDGTTTAGNVGVKAVGNSIYLRAGNNDFVEVDYLGNTRLGAAAALATTATDGFAYIPTCAGVPTGTPTAKTGKVPLVYDTTNDALYIYNGSWKSAAFA